MGLYASLLQQNHSVRDIAAVLNRSPSTRALDDEVLLAGIRSSFSGSDRTYGARRVWHDVLAEGLDAGLHRIERLMRQQGLRAAGAARAPLLTDWAMHDYSGKQNLVQQPCG